MRYLDEYLAGRAESKFHNQEFVSKQELKNSNNNFSKSTKPPSWKEEQPMNMSAFLSHFGNKGGQVTIFTRGTQITPICLNKRTKVSLMFKNIFIL